ncbi:MAG: hypothetical protein KJN67_04195, partial [Pontiella sp.]|nr:hypothetical protein [Pontiella sp.]
VTQWSKGEYYDSNQPQDDLFIIKNKLSYRPDDHGDNDGSASSLVVDPDGAVSQSGVIETTGDPDVFSFETGSGIITISADSYRAASSTWGGNLDILLELYDSTGTLVASNNPALDVDASLTQSVVAGTYYVHVKPTGVGDPTSSPPTGYTVYGSLGQYWISGEVFPDADDDGIPNQWETLYFGGFTNAVASADPDEDGSDNLTEYIAGFDPTDSNSVFKITSFEMAPTGTPIIVTWDPVEGRVYNVLWSDNLLYSPFTNNNLSGDLLHPASSYTDTVYRAGTTHFYRIDVRIE